MNAGQGALAVQAGGRSTSTSVSQGPPGVETVTRCQDTSTPRCVVLFRAWKDEMGGRVGGKVPQSRACREAKISARRAGQVAGVTAVPFSNKRIGGSAPYEYEKLPPIKGRRRHSVRPLTEGIYAKTPPSLWAVPSLSEAEALVGEIVALSAENAVPVLEKDGADVFAHRYLYGVGERAAKAGLNKLDAFSSGTVLIKSPLGSGKTQLFAALARDPALSVLVLCARRTFARSMLADFNRAGLRFRSYLDTVCDCVEGAGGAACASPDTHMNKKFCVATDSRVRRIFVQAQSLFRFENAATTAYDVVIVDESESVLGALNPGITQPRLLENVSVFSALVRNTKFLVGGDAFLSDRSLEVFTALRPAEPIKLLNNMFELHARECERIVVRELDRDGKEREQRARGKNLFHARLEAELKLGKRVVIVCSSRTELDTLREELLEPHAKECAAAGREFKFLCYWAEREDRDERNAELEDVNASWGAADVVAFTPTITVCVSAHNMLLYPVHGPSNASAPHPPHPPHRPPFTQRYKLRQRRAPI